MKRMIIKSAALSLVLMLSLVSALANGKDIKGSISLSQEVRVNDVTLKPGRYEVKFNTETDEVTISNETRVVATVKVNVRSGEEKAKRTQAHISNTDKGPVLAKLVFQGDDRVVTLQDSVVAAKQ